MGFRNLKSNEFEKKTKRIEVKLPLVGHNSIVFFEGEIVSISQYEAICWLENVSMNIGDKLKIQVKPIQERGTPFQIECVVIKKNITQENKEGFFFVLRFDEIQEIGQTQIQSWLEAA